jgi:hypothetical protein
MSDAQKAIRYWKWHSMLSVFRLRYILTPLAIVNQNYIIKDTNYKFCYKEVRVFGVRVARFQLET